MLRRAPALLLPLLPRRGGGVRCVSNAGEAVEWWFMLKTPNGYEYTYADSAGGGGSTLTMQAKNMNDESAPCALTRTLQELAGESNAGPTYLLYNDQPPNGSASSSYGHTKGVVAEEGAAGGLWIVHSTPDFPSSSGRAQFWFPEEEIIYGQSFLCISLSQEGVDTVGGQLLYNRPYVYHSTMKMGDGAPYPNLRKVFAKEWITTPGTHTAQITTPGGVSFTSFAKNKEWDKDLYEYLVAPHYKSGLLVEAWIRGYAVGQYCKQNSSAYDVNDVRTLKVGDVEWKETQDHAKWAVTDAAAAANGVDAACVGDINRMTSQRHRGGGTVCFQHALATMLRRIIVTHDECTGPPVPPGPPTPAPLACCHYDDAACAALSVCCTADCDDPATCSYTESGCAGAYAKKHGCAWAGGRCVVPAPAPTPAPPACCHYDDAACPAWSVCCTTGCDAPATCSYTEPGCAGQYGQAHDCVWMDGQCVVDEYTRRR